jgi:glycerol kinase
MKRSYILALDQGTTSSRAVLINQRGTIVSQGRRALPQIFPQNGWVEQDPSLILSTVLDSIKDCLKFGQVSAEEIAAIGITNQRETTLVWNRLTGLPVHNAIVWQCRRTAKDCETLAQEGWQQHVHKITGLTLDAYFSGTKLHWILEQYDAVAANASDYAFGTVDSWLVWNLAKANPHVSDLTNASRTMLLDIHSLEWDSALLSRLGIPRSILPNLCQNTAEFGVLKQLPGLEALEDIPILAMAGDQHASLFGQGCFHRGDVKNTYGTGCFLLINTGSQPVESKDKLLTTIGWKMDDSIVYALEGSVFNAGSAVDWLVSQVGILSSPRECDELADTVDSSEGVVMVPAFTGLGAPHWDMYARGSIMGLTRASTKAHICRACLDAIAFQVDDLVSGLNRDLGTPIRELRVDGGVSSSVPLLSFQASLLNIPVRRSQCKETTALGVAYMAGLKAGLWQNMEELEALCQTGDVFLPKDPEGASQQKQIWQRAVSRSLHWLS